MAKKCGAKTLSGGLCKRNPIKGCRRCSIHNKKCCKKVRKLRRRRKNPDQKDWVAEQYRYNPFRRNCFAPLKEKEMMRRYRRYNPVLETVTEGASGLAKQAQRGAQMWYDETGREMVSTAKEGFRDLAHRASVRAAKLTAPGAFRFNPCPCEASEESKYLLNPCVCELDTCTCDEYRLNPCTCDLEACQCDEERLPSLYRWRHFYR